MAWRVEGGLYSTTSFYKERSRKKKLCPALSCLCITHLNVAYYENLFKNTESTGIFFFFFLEYKKFLRGKLIRGVKLKSYSVILSRTVVSPLLGLFLFVLHCHISFYPALNVKLWLFGLENFLTNN